MRRGLPPVINCDNGTEFTSRAPDHWAWANQVRLDFSRPGKPTDNAMIEAFNASVPRVPFGALLFDCRRGPDRAQGLPRRLQ
jgi:transposase InsO family protein